MKRQSRDEAKANGRGTQFNGGKNAKLSAGLRLVGQGKQLILTVGIGFWHDREVRGIDTEHEAKMNIAFVEVFIALLLLGLSEQSKRY